MTFGYQYSSDPYAGIYDNYYALEEMLMSIGIAVLAIFGVLMLLGLVGYIFQSIALTRIGRRRGIKASWLIWIPIARNWSIGALADEYDGRNGMKRYFRIILLVCVILSLLISCGSFAGIESVSELVEDIENLDFDNMYPALIKMLITVYGTLIISSLACVVHSTLTYICIYKIYESLSPRRCVLHFVLGLFIPLYQSICLFCLRNKGYPYPDEVPALPETPAEIEKGWYEA
ncbi:MAG: hypothetical protein IJY96_06595 [Oscillospiraceae bacterium]|nr:hypothetical protein [Oscillospiraceae bacterium]